MRRRVVITGIGAVTPLGNDVASLWEGLLAGRSGVGFITEFSTEKLRSDIAARVLGFDPTRYMSPKEAEIHGRVTHFSVAAATEAMTQAGLDPLRRADDGDDEPIVKAGLDRSRIGCLMSTGQGAVDVFEAQIARATERGPRAVSPFFIPAVMPNVGAAIVTMRYGLMGPSYSLASACATGTHSIATSALMIEAGEADVMLAGSAEAATRQNTVAGFGNARALAKALEGDPARASRPFDRRRSGFVMGEGAGALVLEEEQHAQRRGARPLAYVAGFGMSSDGQNLTKPRAEGLGLAMALRRALERAGIQPDDVSYVNPHATSTTQGDMAEYRALREVFGERLARLPMSATKSMLGHLLGAAGAVESIAVVCSLRDQVLHPSINAEEIDPDFAIDLVRERRAADVRYAAKLSAGFGGHNCALVLERF